MSRKVAILLGASGSVGSEVLKALLENPAYEQVVIFVRKPMEPAAKLSQQIVHQMTPESLSDSVTKLLTEISQRDKDVELLAFSALGVGANTAKLTIEQHRAIDVELNRAFARAFKAFPQTKYFGFLSAIGSNPHAKATGSGAAGMPRYARVKGEAEEAVKLHGPGVVCVFRPAMIRGSRHTPKVLDAMAPLFDALIPKRFHSISTRQLAEAMVAASLNPPKITGVYQYPEMIRLIEKRSTSES